MTLAAVVTICMGLSMASSCVSKAVCCWLRRSVTFMVPVAVRPALACTAGKPAGSNIGGFLGFPARSQALRAHAAPF